MPARGHRRAEDLGAEIGAGQADGQFLMPLLQPEMLEPRVFERGRAGLELGIDRGIIDQDLDRPDRFLDRRVGGGDVRLGGHIHAPRDDAGLVVMRGQPACSRLEGGLVDIGQHDRAADLQQRLRMLLAHQPGAAGDDGDLAVYAEAGKRFGLGHDRALRNGFGRHRRPRWRR
jgi:hypothetical protein